MRQLLLLIIGFLISVPFASYAQAQSLSNPDFATFRTRGQALVVATNWNPWWQSSNCNGICVRPEWREWRALQANDGHEVFSDRPHEGGIFQQLYLTGGTVRATIRGNYRLNAWGGADACNSCAQYFTMRAGAGFGGAIPSNIHGLSGHSPVSSSCCDTCDDSTLPSTGTQISATGNGLVTFVLWMDTDFSFGGEGADSYCARLRSYNDLWVID